jgi:prevent-host-death family protein
MTAEETFHLVYAPIVKEHLKAIDRKYHSLIRQVIETQLQHEPEVVTRNRKPLRRSSRMVLADWELRFGPNNRFRVFYQVDPGFRTVYIVALARSGGEAHCGREGSADMRIAPVSDVKARFSDYLRASRSGPVIVTRNGKAIAVLLAVTDDDELERLILSYSPEFQSLLNAAKKQIQETGGIPHEEFWREMEAEEPEPTPE